MKDERDFEPLEVHPPAGDWETTSMSRQHREDIASLHYWKGVEARLERELDYARKRLMEIWRSLGVELTGEVVVMKGDYPPTCPSETADPGNGVGAAESTTTEPTHE